MGSEVNVRRRVVVLFGVAAMLLAACSSGEAPISVPPVSEQQEPKIDDERLEGEQFTRAEKVDICTQVSATAENSDVLNGTPYLEIVEDDEWFCRITGMDWITVPEAATIELAFYEYTDQELQQLHDETIKARQRLPHCDLVVFYDGDLSLVARGRAPSYCEELTTRDDTLFLIRNATVITLHLQLEESPEEHGMFELNDDNVILWTEILELIDQYTPQ